MSNDVNIILEKIKETPVIHSGKESIVTLSSNDVKFSVESFNEAIEYMWEHNLVKILKVERISIYIVKIYVDVAV
ncbi:hypothetical protein psyc5s11_30200 [Clostridium gelidum]|uniref:Uncharacterized protein n=1 Tax=Clostridium gelidum TaxID=704125 RepID=A0ABM7T7F8_9CLOT|nr:hypothetical protein [Clostridium gelidum]BCZ46953.1 hypothetical protein psyc5s11_30200 [Clostridium gelidum]